MIPISIEFSRARGPLPPAIAAFSIWLLVSVFGSSAIVDFITWDARSAISQQEDKETSPAEAESSATSPPSTTFDKAMNFTGKLEGACQNHSSDNGNWYQGKRGFTCYGITPATADNFSKTGLPMPDDITPWTLDTWYDRAPGDYKAWARQGYKKHYWDVITGIDEFPEPVAIVAFDISVHAGPGRAREFLKKTAAIENPKQRALEMNRLMLGYYESLNQPDFIAGWRNRAKEREVFILKYSRLALYLNLSPSARTQYLGDVLFVATRILEK
jgi:hypothetical protein